MKQRLVILLALVTFALGANAEQFETTQGSGGMVTTASYQQAGFNSVMIYENNYTGSYAFDNLPDIGAPSVPISINGRSLLGPGGPGGPGWIPGGEENKPDNPNISYPIGDGTWVLLACAMLFVMFRMVLSKRTKATEQ